MLERLPYFRMHAADYLLDTRDLSFEEHGIYCLLIFNYYWNGALPQDHAAIEKLIGIRSPEQSEMLDKLLARFFKLEGDRIVHLRIDRELEKMKAFFNKQHRAAVASVAARAATAAKKHAAHKGNGAKPPADTGEVIERIPLNTGEEFEIRQSYADELKRLYPSVDVPQTLREARGWCLANPTKRKTQTGVRRFINRWMTQEQNRG